MHSLSHRIGKKSVSTVFPQVRRLSDVSRLPKRPLHRTRNDLQLFCSRAVRPLQRTGARALVRFRRHAGAASGQSHGAAAA